MPKKTKVSPPRNFSQYLVLILMILEVLLTVWLITSRRLPIHDTFSRLCVQYFLFNNVVQYGELPQWIPYFTHGATAMPWYSAYNVLGIFLYAISLFGVLFKKFNFLILSYGGILFDHLILLTGTLLLGKRYFSSRYTHIFTAVCVLGSAVWPSQTYFNFHLYYGLPLVLYFLHRWLEEGRWSFAFWGLNFLIIQSLGQLAYCVPILTLCIFIYLVTFAIISPGRLQQLRKSTSWNSHTWLPAALFVTSFIALITLWFAGIKDPQIFRLISGRLPDGSVTFQQFLLFQGPFNFWKLLEIFWGASLERDYTFYIGITGFFMFLAGIVWGTTKKNAPLFISALALLLISTGTILAQAAYFWPLMKYFRHLHLMLPLAKLFICFIAGAGFEAFASGTVQLKSRKGVLFILTGVSGLIFLAVLIFQPPLNLKLAALMGHSKYTTHHNQEYLLNLFSGHNIIQFIKIGSLFFFTAYLYQNGQSKKRPVILIGLLAILFFENYNYKVSEYKKRSVVLTQAEWDNFTFQPLSFQRRRLAFDTKQSSRYSIFDGNFRRRSSHYWTFNAYTLMDTLDTYFRTEYWQKAFNEYLRVWKRGTVTVHTTQNTNNVLTIKPRYQLAKISGVTEDKIQFFTTAHMIPEIKDLSPVFNNQNFSGDQLFISTPGTLAPPEKALSNWDPAASADSHRLSLPYEVKLFQANRLQAQVVVPGEQPVWMFYSDAWAPGWEAAINGTRAPVYQAQAGYKAVLLPPGQNTVEFCYRSAILNLCLLILAAQALFWLIYCVKLQTEYLVSDQ